MGCAAASTQLAVQPGAPAGKSAVSVVPEPVKAEDQSYPALPEPAPEPGASPQPGPRPPDPAPPLAPVEPPPPEVEVTVPGAPEPAAAISPSGSSTHSPKRAATGGSEKSIGRQTTVSFAPPEEAKAGSFRSSSREGSFREAEVLSVPQQPPDPGALWPTPARSATHRWARDALSQLVTAVVAREDPGNLRPWVTSLTTGIVDAIIRREGGPAPVRITLEPEGAKERELRTASRASTGASVTSEPGKKRASFTERMYVQFAETRESVHSERRDSDASSRRMSVQHSQLIDLKRTWVNNTLSGIIQTIVSRIDTPAEAAARKWVDATLDSIVGKVAAR